MAELQAFAHQLCPRLFPALNTGQKTSYG